MAAVNSARHRRVDSRIDSRDVAEEKLMPPGEDNSTKNNPVERPARLAR